MTNEKKITINQMVVRKYLFLAGLFAVPFINFAVFWLYLNISAVDFAFKLELSDGTVIYSLKNFESLFKAMTMPNSTFWIALKNTLLYWFTSAILGYALALVISYFLYKKVPGHGFYKVIFYLPNLIAPTILVTLFKQIIAANGPLVKLYGSFEAVPKFLASPDIAIWTCLFYSLFFGFGTNLLILSGAMSQIDSSVVEAAKLDGVNMAQEMFNVVIPIIWPSVVASMITSIAGIFNASGPILLLTGGAYNTRTISYWIYEQVYTGQNYYYPAAIGLFFAIIAIPLTIFSRWLLRKVVPSNDGVEEE
ncbi:MAG: sugar ABC transporter permease [Clostridia bacterium]|nr:sugar ABC transporter permease [Clostridia bacterium]